jgi:cellulose biosynthesis protein BcsQ
MMTTRQGRIVTFYSYKGGTGRTMALANIAWILASNGHKVLAVDWDLESPGLHRYFHPFLIDKELRSTPGVIDLIREYATATMDAAPPEDPDWYRELAAIERYVVSLDYRFPNGGLLDFIPPGKQDTAYSRAVSTFDWGNFYDRQGGGVFLDAVGAGLRSDYTYVLIDSRTGLADTAGVCTGQLADVVVNCFTLSTQSIDGAVAVQRSLDNIKRGRNVRIMPVPMRVEDAEQTKLEVGRDYARARFEDLLDFTDDADRERYWGEVEIPYKSFYAYEEVLATVGDRPRLENTLLSAYERLARSLTDGQVTNLVPMDEADRRRRLVQYERLPAPVPTRVRVSHAPEDRMWADWIVAQLSAVGLRVSRESTVGTTGGHVTGAEVVRTVALLSPDYVKSPLGRQVWQEVTARDPNNSHRLLIPVRLSGAQLPEPFDDRPALDMSSYNS